MPIKIGPNNVEELVFMDSKAWSAMPSLKHHRDQWSLSLMSPSLRPTGKKALLDFLRRAGPDEASALSEHFGTEVTIDKLDYRCTQEVEFRAGDHPDFGSFYPCSGIAATREGDVVRVTLWR